MATRMQQRRGTAEQWTTADPILAAGEIGFESDTSQFKIGDGVNNWSDLSYFKNLEDLGGTLDDYVPLTQKGALGGVATLDSNGHIPVSQLSNLIDGAPEALDTLKEIADAVTLVTTHKDSTENVHGIANTADLITTSSLADYLDDYATLTLVQADYALSVDVATDISTAIDPLASKTYAEGLVSTHNSDTTNVHGISDTSEIAYLGNVAGSISEHANVTANVHGISDTSEIAYLGNVAGSISEHANVTANVHGIADTSLLVTTVGGQSIDGTTTVENLEISGALTFTGTATQIDTTNLSVTDSLIYLAAEQFDSDILDIGMYGAYGDGNSGHFHTGLIRDASNGKWNLISNGNEPSNNTIDLTNAVYDTVKLGGVEFADGTQTKQGVPSITPITLVDDLVSSSPHTLNSISLRDNLIEVAAASAFTIVIPTNSAVAYPVGTSFDILQTGSGQVTIAGDTGVTVNATPGLKLRTTWSSATLFKRSENSWVVYGDLKA